MATWSDVELLTNEDTNTVRFGNVSREESDSGLYQLDTLVKISTANEVTLMNCQYLQCIPATQYLYTVVAH